MNMKELIHYTPRNPNRVAHSGGQSTNEVPADLIDNLVVPYCATSAKPKTTDQPTQLEVSRTNASANGRNGNGRVLHHLPILY
ncbi:hypothetical protein JG687_00010482 [Phytophthora cactorum]|uniref:Uncharacterized protein n=1 Tax=Phytophthora cactorum TaxID=29920 RepID=A0A8T1U9E7_9STRA|nr:hypothetical protein JG687_00010482 [Phytophthora cactorum]